MFNKVVVIEDNNELLSLIRKILEKDNYRAILHDLGKPALESIKAEHPILILLDINLPDISGMELLKLINSDSQINNIPVILMTGKYKKNEDIVKGLKSGADDYIVKPFTPDLLMARIETVLRRSNTHLNSSELIKVGRISINLTYYAAYKDNELITLSKSEFKLLHFLIRKPGVPMDTMDIIEHIWQDYEGNSDRSKTLNKLVNRLRNKLGADGPNLIKTEYGIGYKFCIEGENNPK